MLVVEEFWERELKIVLAQCIAKCSIVHTVKLVTASSFQILFWRCMLRRTDRHEHRAAAPHGPTATTPDIENCMILARPNMIQV